ncbi:MAG: hypothetical protein GYA36_09320 [Veillonellaceae bacterium]|nr:hypothetical protein [Veillonellaceae bacterium]
MELPFYLEPLGSYHEIISHPYNVDEAVSVAVFHEHRIAFYYWADWTKGIIHGRPKEQPPTLVTFDWHEDTASPCADECRELEELDLSRLSNIAFFSWAKLNPLNDGHILSAAYLNLLADIFIVCKQKIGDHPVLTDIYGNEHRIYCFSCAEEMRQVLVQYSSEREIYLDVDLDFFTESDDPHGGGNNISLVSESVIESIFNPHSTIMKFVLPRLAGMTIALEPEFCGGISNMYALFHALEKSIFNGALLSGKTTWKK